MARTLNRRQVLALGGVSLAAAVAACQSQAIEVPTKAPAASGGGAPPPTQAPAAGATPAATAAAAGGATPAAPAATKPAAATPAAGATVQAAPQSVGSIANVPREQTVIWSVSDELNQFADTGIFNPFLQGARRTGWHFAFEPLYFYNPYWTDEYTAPPGLKGAKGEIPYQAESYAYNADNTEITVKLRKGVEWSDGKPFTSKDVQFTLHMLRDNAPKLNFSTDVKLWVKEVQTPDDLTARIVLNNPNPQFFFQFFQWHQDAGFPIVPAHVFQGQDPLTFTNLDLSKGSPVTTGPWKLVFASPEQKIFDRRDDWWGAKSGFHALPKMKRVVVLPHFEDPKLTQLLVAGQVDSTHNLQPSDTEVVLSKNKKTEVFTANQGPPYGSLDWWPTALSFNDSKAPFDDPEIRWAINHAIDRKQLIDVGFRGTTRATVLPFPDYPAMKPYFDAVQDLLKAKPIDAYDPNKTAQIMQSKGWQKDAEGFWAKGGQRFPFVILLPPGFFQNSAPVVVAQLRKAGFDASFKSPTNAGTLMSQGDVDAFLQGHGGGIRDPYLTLIHYHGRYYAPTGEPAQQSYRWRNADYDKLVDQIATVQPGTDKFMQLYHQAMEIWIRELPDIPLNQWYLIMPVFTQYWKGWPNEKNPYTAPSSWHRGAAGLILQTLEPASG
ncbi:MAG TPA: ABC transporter substrate-binding protein [Chloroflexota bacterium]|nr:ABC transporter substrate-binding protein [Chloroflexota bacterium]